MTRKRLIVVSVAVLAAAGAALLLRPAPFEVEVAPVVRGLIRVTVEGSGRTRVRDVYVVAAPVAGQLLRLPVREGDRVATGAAVAALRPAAAPPLDARARRELAGRLEAARAAQAAAVAREARARAAAEQAARDGSRAEALARAGAAPARDAEAAVASLAAAEAEVREAAAGVKRAAAEVEAARAALAASEGSASGEELVLRAPSAGVILRVHRESEGPVAAGTPLLDVGDPSSLEVDLELLTADAVRVRPGAAVEVAGWGAGAPLAGRVLRTDPAAYTKVSALGVEEQRVHVVVAPGGGDGWAALGDGFAVDGRVVIAQRDGALLAPASALFRSADGWATFVVERGRARLRRAEVAEVGDGVVAVTAGLAEGERLVLHPADTLADGVRVSVGAVAR